MNELDELIREERSEMDSIPQALGYSTKKVLISPNDIFNMIKRCFQNGKGPLLFNVRGILRGIYNRLYPSPNEEKQGGSKELTQKEDYPQL